MSDVENLPWQYLGAIRLAENIQWAEEDGMLDTFLSVFLLTLNANEEQFHEALHQARFAAGK